MSSECQYLRAYLRVIKKPLPQLKKTFQEELKLLLRYAKNKKVLDVGCGAGRPADKLAKYCQEIFCIEIDNKLVSIAKKALLKIKNARVEKMDALNMSFKANSFDFVYATYNLIGSLEKKEDKMKLIREMKRVVKKQGVIMVAYWKNDESTGKFLKKCYSHYNKGEKVKIYKITSRASYTNIGKFERTSKTFVEKLFREQGLRKIKTIEIGLWKATFGVKS